MTPTRIRAGGRPGEPSTTPRPHLVSPGSTPSTRIGRRAKVTPAPSRDHRLNICSPKTYRAPPRPSRTPDGVSPRNPPRPRFRPPEETFPPGIRPTLEPRHPTRNPSTKKSAPTRLCCPNPLPEYATPNSVATVSPQAPVFTENPRSAEISVSFHDRFSSAERLISVKMAAGRRCPVAGAAQNRNLPGPGYRAGPEPAQNRNLPEPGSCPELEPAQNRNLPRTGTCPDSGTGPDGG
jgi:hypothetical protein